MNNHTLLIADIGGTKSDLALFDTTNVRTPTYRQRFNNAEYSGIDDILSAFMATAGTLPAVACFAVAGLVQEGVAQMTNLPWKLSVHSLKNTFSFTKVLLINDLTAVASSIRFLDVKNKLEIQTIYPGSGTGGDVVGIVAPGTGLGQGFVVTMAGRTFVTGTEGGHTGFAPANDEQIALLKWAQKEHSPVSYETLIAGPGLGILYDFCKNYHSMKESDVVAAAMARSIDRTPSIIQGATESHSCELCTKVVHLFLSILGSEAGNLALKLYAKGGIYLGGGILPRLVDHVSFDGFIDSYLDKGDMSSLVKEIPVQLILHKNSPLMGAAGYLVEYLATMSPKE